MSTATTTRPASRARSWYVINRKPEDSSAEVKIYEDIGMWGVSAKAFSDDIEEIEAKTIHVRLNTNGGDTFDGIAIYNALRAHPARIVVHVDGLAASAGSIIACAGDEIRMADNAFLMIHENRAGVFGEAEDMRKYAEVLDKLNDSVASTYQNRAGKTRKYWREKMAEETWYTASEAKDEGLCDCVDDRETAAEAAATNRRFDFKIYNHVHHVPEAVQKAWGTQTIENAPEASPCGDPPPAVTSQEATMPTENQPVPAQNSGGEATPQQQQTPAPAAPQPAAAIDAAKAHSAELDRLKGQTAKATFEQGRAKGRDEGREAERARLKSILDACPGKPQMALDAFFAAQTPEAAKLAYNEVAKAEAEAQARVNALELERARWENIANAGGVVDGIPIDLASGGTDGDDDEERSPKMEKKQAEDYAKLEWDRKPSVRKGYSSKENYVAFRVAELTGRLKPANAR